MNAVPTIEISRRGVAEEVARTCEQTGFLIISGHNYIPVTTFPDKISKFFKACSVLSNYQ